MDWKIALTAFGVTFLAELGDKTQLAALVLAAERQRPLSVFVGASAALVVASAIAVLGGGLAADWIPLAWIRRGGGLALIAAGLWMVVRA